MNSVLADFEALGVTCRIFRTMSVPFGQARLKACHSGTRLAASQRFTSNPRATIAPLVGKRERTLGMASPFPGMDPYLESYLWPDVHNALASKIRQFLTPLLRPRYTARLAIYVVEDVTPEGDIGIMYPDVEVMQRENASHSVEEAMHSFAIREHVATPATLSIPVVLPVDIHIPVVEIRDTAQNRLITSIKLLSPVNKREPGLTQYRQKRQRLYQAGVHLIEIDLLRRGTRPIIDARLADAPYLIGLTRAHAGRTDVWQRSFTDVLPTLPIPLRQPDDDVLLDLGEAFRSVYDEAGYDLSIDYDADPPPPALHEADLKIVRELLRQR